MSRAAAHCAWCERLRGNAGVNGREEGAYSDRLRNHIGNLSRNEARLGVDGPRVVYGSSFISRNMLHLVKFLF